MKYSSLQKPASQRCFWWWSLSLLFPVTGLILSQEHAAPKIQTAGGLKCSGLQHLTPFPHYAHSSFDKTLPDAAAGPGESSPAGTASFRWSLVLVKPGEGKALLVLSPSCCSFLVSSCAKFCIVVFFFPVMRILGLTQLLCKQTGPCKTLISAFSHQSKSRGFELFKGQHLINNEGRRRALL